jgi:hypothetical protein
VLTVQPWGCQNVHEIEVFLLEHHLEVVIGTRVRVELGATSFCPTDGAISEGHNVNLGNPSPSFQMKFGDHSTAEKSSPQPAHQLAPPYRSNTVQDSSRNAE